MINSHKEFVGEVKRFCEKMDFIENFIYNTDASKLELQIEQLGSRGVILTLRNADFDDDYNYNLSYGFTIVADTLGEVDSFVTSEEENLFVVSALDDYLNHVLDVPVSISNLDLGSDNTGGEVRVALTGIISFPVKRTASYWKKMEEFAV